MFKSTLPKVARIAPREDLNEPIRAPMSEFEKGGAAFVDEMQALGGGLVGMAGQAVAQHGPEIARPMAEQTRDWGLDVYKRNMEEATEGVQAPKVARIEDIKLGEEGGAGRFGDWAAYQGTKGLATLGTMFAGGGIGGAVAKGLVKKEVKALANKKLASTLKDKGISAGARKAAAAQVGKAVTKGRIAGALGTGFGMEGGESFGGMVTDGVAPEKALGPAAAVGGINAALEFVAPFKVAKGLGLLGPAKQGILQKIRDVPELRKKAQMLAGRVAKGAAGTGATEGITEGVQELVQLAGERWAKDEKMLAGLDPEAQSQIWNAAAAGALTGGLFGGAAGPFTAKTGPTETSAPQADVEQQIQEGVPSAEEEQAAPAAAQTEAGAPAPAATPTKPELTTAQWREVVSQVQPRPEETPQEFTQRLALIEQSTLAGEWIPAEQLSAEEAPAELSGLLERPFIEGQVVRPAIEGEVVQDAEAIREDARLLPGPGQEQQLLQREGGEDRELITQEGGEIVPEVAPDEGSIPLTFDEFGKAEAATEALPGPVEKAIPAAAPKVVDQLLLPDLREKVLAQPKLGAVNEATTQEEVIQPAEGQTVQDAAIADIESRPTPELKELTGSLLELYQSGDLTPSQYRDVRQVLARGEMERVADIIRKVEETGRQPGVSYQRRDAKMTADMSQILNLIGMKMYKGAYSDVVIKELMQNSFDAVKEQSAIMEVPGRIDVLVNHGDNSITIRDDGVGMTLDEVQDVFLKLGGTGKGGKGTSGGLGFAKGSFLPGASRVVLETTKNGKTTRMDVDPKQLMLGKGAEGALDNSGPVAAQGTTLTLYIPETYTNEEGETQDIQFPYAYSSISFFQRPLIGPTEINYYETYSDFTPQEAFETLEPKEVVPQGINFDLEKAGVVYHTPAKTGWGTMEIYFGKKRHMQGWQAKQSVLSDGIFQFDLDLKEDGSWDRVPYDMIINIKSNVTTRSAKYPFNNSREGFSKGVEEDVKALKKYLLNIAGGISASETAQNFENMKQLPRVEIEGVPKKLEGDELRKAQDAQKEFVKEKPKPKAKAAPKKIKIADGKVWETDSRGRAKGDPVVDTTFKAEKEETKRSDFLMDMGGLDREKPVYHNNTTVDYVEEFGAPAAGFFSELGSVMTEMLELAGAHGGFGYRAMRKEKKDSLIFAGISIDKSYHGVTVKVPYEGFFLNPLAPGDAKSLPGMSESFYLTMVHELAHSQSMKHDERHTLAIHSLYNRFADLGLNIELTEKIGNVLYKYKDFYNPMREKYDESTTSNVAESLDKGEGATKLERFGYEPAPDVATAEGGVVRSRGGSEMGRTLESRTDMGRESTVAGVKPRTVEQARREVADALSAGWVRRAENAGMLEFVETEGPNGQSADFDQGSGKITIYTKSLPEEGTAAAVALHEGSHAGMDVMLGGKLGKFAKEVHSMAESNDIAKQAVAKGEAASWQWLADQLDVPFDPANPEGTRTAVNAALKEAPNAQELEAERQSVRDEEVLAYYVQEAATKGGGLFRRIVNSIKAGWLTSPIGRALSRAGLGPQLSDGVAVELAKRSTKFALSLQETARKLDRTPDAQGRDVLESRVWHASPHNWAPEPGFPFGRPRLDKVGTGEGGQLFGWGWYSAENEEVSGPGSTYDRSFSGQQVIEVDGQEVAQGKGRDPKSWWLGNQEYTPGGPAALALDLINMFGADGARTELAYKAVDAEDPFVDRYTGAKAWLDSHEIEEVSKGASIFRLKIPDSAIGKMLRWEEPLSKQPPAVKEALEGIRAKLEKERKAFVDTQVNEEAERIALNVMWTDGEQWGVRRKEIDPAYELDEAGVFVRGPFAGFELRGSDEKPYVSMFGRKTYLSPDVVTGYVGDLFAYNTKEDAQDAQQAVEAETVVKRIKEGVSWKQAVARAKASQAVKNFEAQLQNSPHMPPNLESGTGEQLYQSLQESLPQVPGEHRKKKVSEYLASLGIVGNKYLDWGSRGGGLQEARLVFSNGKEVKSATYEMRAVGDMLQRREGSYTEVRKELTANMEREGESNAYKRDQKHLLEALRQMERAGVNVAPQTFNYVVWDQPTLDAVAHLNPQNDMQKFGIAAKRFRDALSAETSSLERMSSALAERGKLESQPESVSAAWYTSPVSNAPEEVNRPGILNKIQHNYVEKFSDLWTKSKEAATKFNLAKSKRSSAQQDFEDEFVTPWVKQTVKLSKALTQEGKPFSVEQANDAFAAWHIVEDKVNMSIARKNSNEQSIHLETAMRKAAVDVGKDTALGKELIRLANEHAKGRKNLLKGKNWDGSQPMASDGVTTRELTSSEVKMKMTEKLEALFNTPIEDTKVWKATVPLEDQRMGWEMLKNHGAGFATPENVSSDPEVRQKVNDILGLDPSSAPKNAHELYDEVKDNATFQAMAVEAQKVATLTRKTLVRGGLITQEEADAMGKEYKHWVPLRREQYDFQSSVDALFARAGRGGRPQVRAGTPEVDAPVHAMQNLFASYDAAITAAESNIAREFFAKKVEEDPQAWDGWFKVEQDKDAMRSYGKYGFVKTTKASTDPGDIPFYRDGERWLLKPDKKNERAKMISVAVQNLDAQELGPVFKLMQGVNSWIRWANISASPAFLLVNAPRDFGTAMLNLKGTKLADFTGNVAKEVKSSAKDLWKHFHPDPNKRVKSAAITEWERAGGRISFVESLRPNDATWGSLESQIRHRQGVFQPLPGQEILAGEQAGVAVEKARDFLERIERMNIIAENVMRYSTWKVAKDKGLSNDEAALLSKDVTTNFDRKGLRAKTLGTYWLFYNATVQGNAQVLRNVFKGANKEKLWGALAATMAFAFLNDQLGAALSDDEDGDGRTDWDSTAEWKKEKFGRIAGSNLFWPGESEKFATVPLPWVFNTVWRMGEMMSEAARGVKDVTEIPADTVGLMLNTFNPIGSSDTTGLQMASPTAFDPLVQIAENVDAFGRPLGPTQFPGQEHQPDSQMAWLSTPPRYKWLAREMNQLTGGSAAEKGLVDWRPSTFKVLADTLMGGGGRFVEQMGTSAVSTAQGKPPAAEKWPMLKPFLFDPADPIEAGLYHERQAKIAQAAKAERVFKSGPERDLMELQRVRREYAGELRMKKTADDVARQIKDLRKQLRQAQSNGQENRVDVLKKRIEQAQQRFNKTWNSRAGN